MTPFYADDWLTIYEGDCRTVMEGMPADSVDCVVTSPPYWGLRDYGTATWVGGDAECDHEPDRTSPSSTLQGGKATQGQGRVFRGSCGRCGASRQDSQLGLERTPEEYVADMVAVFREVRRVLKPSGTCWLNLGDSYASDMKGSGGPSAKQDSNTGSRYQPIRLQHGLKPKDLVGIPWRVAFALQADGWYLRSDIIWSKPNPMPESVTDRPTKSHEYLFLLTKSARYYFDADAVREAAGEWPGYEDKPQGSFTGKHGDAAFRAIRPTGRNIRSVWTIATVPYGNVTIGDAEGGHRDTLSPDCPVHSLRAIRRSLRTDGDDALLDRLRSRSPRIGANPAPMPADGLFANLNLDSLDPDQSTPDSPPAGSSPVPTPGSAHASRTPARQTSGGGQGSDAGIEHHTSHTPSPTTDQDVGELSEPDVPSATGRSERESRTSAGSAPLGSASPAPESRTPDTDAPRGPDEPHPHTSESSSAEDSAQRDPAAQTDAGMSGRCTCPDYSASHFAVFPPELPERCIKAGSSERGVCPECGAPWERVVERSVAPAEVFTSTTKPQDGHVYGYHKDGVIRGAGQRLQDWRDANPPQTTGWQPTCPHPTTLPPFDMTEKVGNVTVPAVILDPFAGSGTVGLVANRLSRRAILIDLNPEYLKQQMKRNAQTPLGLTEPAA